MKFFILLSGLLAAGALAMLLPPLLRRRTFEADSGVASNRTVYAEQLDELDAELRSGAIGREQWEMQRDEITRRVLDETALSGHAAPLGRGERQLARSWAAAIAVAMAVPVAAIVFYGLVGTPGALIPASTTASMKQTPTPEQVDAMVAKLHARMLTEPGDTEGWLTLGRAYAGLGRYPDAADAYAKAASQRPDDARVLADYAEVLAFSRGRDFSGEPEALIARALKADGKNVKALGLAGTRAYLRQDYRGAIGYWQRMLPLVPQGSELAASVSAGIAEAEGKLATAVNVTPLK
jgi:cytochrome c-type biogenesis protein CcmH